MNVVNTLIQILLIFLNSFCSEKSFCLRSNQFLGVDFLIFFELAAFPSLNEAKSFIKQQTCRGNKNVNDF